ncbi:MAG: Sarcosine/dimethylglycine N-methyltransferase [Pelotomaculum sp. PtaU1.Bin035]|nr:MAG: Sarcosine/dimethylglycine N-methyltransferase [Pelotomaculum sp. PtaU1.Bin035]
MNSYLDAIAAMGTGSLHPGGFSHTLNVLQRLSLSTNDIVLDIGCGTGRTACHIAKTSGAYVFALDNSEEMLHKSKYRASHEGVQVQFIHGDARDMPFQDEVIDLIFIESVLIFLPARTVLQECFRTLKTGGILVDVEMCAGKSIPLKVKEQLQTICDIPHIPTFEEWLEMFYSTGFAQANTSRNHFPGLLDNIINILHPDPYQIVSQKMETKRELNNVLQKYMEFIHNNRKYLEYGTFIMRKGNK